MLASRGSVRKYVLVSQIELGCHDEVANQNYFGERPP